MTAAVSVAPFRQPTVLQPIAVPLILRRVHKHRVEDHLGLARRFCRRFCKKGERVEDTDQYSDALIGLWDACEGHDQQIAEFSTYAFECMRKRVCEGHRNRTRKKRSVPETGLVDLDLIAGPEKQENEEVDPGLSVDLLLGDHPDDTPSDKFYKSILQDHYLHGKSWAEIGREQGFSRCWAMQCGQKAIALIRERYNIRVGDAEQPNTDIQRDNNRAGHTAAGD